MNKYILKSILLNEEKAFVEVRIVLPYNETVLKPKASISFISENYTRRLPLELNKYMNNTSNHLAYLDFSYKYNLMYLWNDVDDTRDFEIKLNINYGNTVINNQLFDEIQTIEFNESSFFATKVEKGHILFKTKGKSIYTKSNKILKNRKKRVSKNFINATFYSFFYIFVIIIKPFIFIFKMILKGLLILWRVFTLYYLKKRVKKQLKRMRPMFLRIINWYSKYIKVDPNLVIFLSESRNDLSGNFEFVYNELKENPDTVIRTYIQDVRVPQTRCFRNNRIKDIARAKIIILDDYYPHIYNRVLKPEQKIIQLWHACGAFKTFGFSRLGKKGGPKQISKNHRNYDAVIVSSDEIAPLYAEAFGIPSQNVYATGVPRTDIFFDETYKQRYRKEFFNEFPQAINKKIILFAPTFRGNGKKTAYYPMEKIDIARLHELLGDDYFFIHKMHPFVKNKLTIPQALSSFAIDLSNAREINDLLFVTDILITDYSSVIFEASLLNIPMYFYAYDLEKYIESRDFYYDYPTLVPGAICKELDELAHAIHAKEHHLEKMTEFKHRFFNDFDGLSTKRVVTLIKQKMEE